MGDNARSSSEVRFRPKINFAYDSSRVAGDDLAAGDSVLLDDSRIEQKQNFSERGPGDQNIAQSEVQEDVGDA